MNIKFKLKYLNIIGIILLFSIIYQIGLDNIVKAFYKIDLFYLFIAIGLIVPLTLMRGLKWLLITKYHNVKFSFSNSCIIYLIGQYFSILTPGRIGEIIKALYVKEKTKTLSKPLSIIIVDRFIDMFALLLFSLFGAFYLASYFTDKLFIQLFVFLIIVLISTILFLKKRFLSKLLKPIYLFIIPARFKATVLNHFNELYDELTAFSKKYLNIIFLIVFGLTLWFIGIIQGYMLILSLQLDVNFLYFAAIAPIVVSITLLPITISGIGTREASFIFFLSLVGVPPESSVAYSILEMIVTYLAYGLIGWILWFKKPLKLNYDFVK